MNAMATLDALFRPRSVAIVGASSDPNKVGGRPLAFLRRGGFAGRVLPVNPGANEVQGIPAYASLDMVPGTIDQAIIAVPAAQVLAVAEQCIARGVKALQIFSAGFGEGPQARERQAALAARAREGGTRVLGPNSLGLFNVAEGFFGTFATALDGAWPRVGGIGVATQSGAFGSYFFGMAQQRGLGFSHFVATGNESDVDVADCIEFFAADPATRLIVMAIEGCRDGRKLARALRAARAAGKPVLAMKVGVSQAGARAAATHTGSLSGEDRVFDAVLRDCGAHRAASLDALVDAACVAGAGPLPRGKNLLVVTTSGGIGVLSADAAEASGLELPAISDSALGDIRQVAALADGHNPVDTSTGILGDLSAYARIAGRAMADRPFDAALLYLAHIARNPVHWGQLREPLYALRARHPAIAFCAVLLANDAVSADLEAHGFAVFIDPSRAVQAIAACASAGTDEPNEPRVEQHDAQRILAGPLATERDAKQALSAQGIRFAPEAIARDADEAVRAVQAVGGYPVVLKIVSPDIAHKTEAGGVQVGIASDDALRAALPAMRGRVSAFAPLARIDGFLVARQLSGGVELLVGTQRDPVFGPVVTVGAGGVLAELVADVCVRLAPVDAAQAREMLLATRAGRLLQGWRGGPAADIDSVAAQVAALSEVAWANRHTVSGIDLNPVLARPDGAFALDALIATD
ncbi:MAG: acetate--CoA ligase family protein [Ramlibacter sp.]